MGLVIVNDTLPEQTTSLGAFESGVARLARPARRTLLGLLPPPQFGMLREKW